MTSDLTDAKQLKRVETKHYFFKRCPKLISLLQVIYHIIHQYRKELSATGDDLCYILVEALDANGVLCPLADNLIKFKVDGHAEIAGIDNGNPLSYELFHDSEHKLFFGKAMVILRTKEGGEDKNIRLVADSDGLTSAVLLSKAASRVSS
jgi:hypothetical protein